MLQGQTLAACSAGSAGTAPYLQYAVTEDNHLVVTGGSHGAHSPKRLNQHRLRLPKAWGALQVGLAGLPGNSSSLQVPIIAEGFNLVWSLCEDPPTSVQAWLTHKCCVVILVISAGGPAQKLHLRTRWLRAAICIHPPRCTGGGGMSPHCMLELGKCDQLIQAECQ